MRTAHEVRQILNQDIQHLTLRLLNGQHDPPSIARQREQWRRVALGNVASVLLSGSRRVVQLLAYLLRTLY